MTIRLIKEQRDILIELTKYYKWNKRLIFRELPECIILDNLNDDEKTELRELCCDYLVETGFDIDHNVNRKGVLLEELIDRLYVV